MILLDTSVLIEILKDKNKVPSIIKKLPDDNLAISTVTVAEIELGFNFLPQKHKDEKRKLFLEFLQSEETHIFPVDTEVARVYADLQVKLMKKGKPLGRFDGLIAATAQVANLPLYTTDNDFSRVEEIEVKLLT